MSWEFFKLLFAPRVLPRLSASASGFVAGLVGGAVLGIEVGLAAAAAAWGFNEPFGSFGGTFGDYLQSGSPRLALAPMVGVIGFVVGGLLGAVVARGDGLIARVVRVGLLAPLPLLIPTVLCAAAAVIGGARYNVSVSVPEWTYAFPFQVAASPLPMFAWPLAWFWMWCWAVSKLERPVRKDCAKCGYSRQGLPSMAVCPECGSGPAFRQ